jgi:hypothetical protein
MRLAFVKPGENETMGWNITLFTIDLFFLIDIMVIFNTALYDEYYNVIT